MTKDFLKRINNHEQLCMLYAYLETKYIDIIIKTHGSESRGQEEVACTRVFRPT